MGIKGRDMARTDGQGVAARRAALRLLGDVTGQARPIPEAVAAGAFDGLDAADRARAQRLATDVLRQFDRLDAVLKPHLSRNPPLAVRNALRLGTLELSGGAAAHGVVDTLVGIVAGGKRTGAFKGLVNAVLRKVAAAPPDLTAMPVPHLPRWLRTPLVDAWGQRAVAAMEAVQVTRPPLDLTAKGDAATLADTLGGTLLPTGSVRLSETAQVSALPGYDAGDWWVQDAAAALPVRMFGDLAGRRALDLCAAPGGKTMQLAAAGAHVTAVDDSAPRMDRVTRNLARTGLPAEIRIADAFGVTGAWDAILLDAPCSATGTIRRHPDLPRARDGSGFAALIAQQARMIDHALALLAPGGQLVFCTCSLLPDEGEVQIEEALVRHPGLRVLPALPDGADPAWRTEEGGLRLRPDTWADRGGVDGFYMACLARD